MRDVRLAPNEAMAAVAKRPAAHLTEGRKASFEGSDAELEKLLSKHATTPEWIVYAPDSPPQKAQISKVKDFWQDVKHLQPNLSLKKNN